MKNIANKIFPLSLMLLALPFAIVAVLLVTGFIIIMSIWDRFREPYLRCFRLEVLEKERTQLAEMKIRSTLCLIIQEMTEHRRPWTVEDFESVLHDIRDSRDSGEIIMRGEKEGYWARVDNAWKLTDEGANFAEEFSRTIGR